MLKFFVRRIFWSIPLLLLVMLATFALMRGSGGSPFQPPEGYVPLPGPLERLLSDYYHLDDPWTRPEVCDLREARLHAELRAVDDLPQCDRDRRDPSRLPGHSRAGPACGGLGATAWGRPRHVRGGPAKDDLGFSRVRRERHFYLLSPSSSWCSVLVQVTSSSSGHALFRLAGRAGRQESCRRSPSPSHLTGYIVRLVPRRHGRNPGRGLRTPPHSLKGCDSGAIILVHVLKETRWCRLSLRPYLMIALADHRRVSSLENFFAVPGCIGRVRYGRTNMGLPDAHAAYNCARGRRARGQPASSRS